LERQTKTSGRAVFAARVRKQARSLCYIATTNPCAATAPHRTENKARCVWKNAAVEQRSKRTLPFKTERFIPAVKTPLRF
jgi:hypothetical protein